MSDHPDRGALLSATNNGQPAPDSAGNKSRSTAPLDRKTTNLIQELAKQDRATVRVLAKCLFKMRRVTKPMADDLREWHRNRHLPGYPSPESDIWGKLEKLRSAQRAYESRRKCLTTREEKLTRVTVIRN